MAKKYDRQAGNLFKKEVPKMPESYYSGDKPNANLREFVDQHIKERPYAPDNDNYDVSAFDKPIEATKVDPIYNLHPYDSKKSHAAIRQYIKHYTTQKDLVLDPFCGSGSTLVAACEEGCSCIGIDFSPLATLISSEIVSPRQIEDIDKSFFRLKRSAEHAVRDLYMTTCHRCGHPAEIMGTVISEKFQCLRCLETHPWYVCINTDENSKRLCPSCHSRGVESLITTSFERKGYQIVQVDLKCMGKCKPKRSSRTILDKDPESKTRMIEDIRNAANISVDIPDRLKRRMMNTTREDERWGLLWRPYLRGYDTPADFFTPRNLKACLLLHETIRKIGDITLLLALSSILAKASHLMAQNPDGIGRVMKGTYYIGAVRREVNVWNFFEDAYKAILKAKMVINSLETASVMISCQDSTDLDVLPSNCIDYIFTDPPYSGKVQFGELNFLRESFLDIGVAKLKDEIIINEVRELDEVDWSIRMRAVANHLFRILKPGRWATLCYHDTSEGTWENIQDIMAETGFLSDESKSAVFIETRQKSIKQITADKVNKRDLVVNFRKPRPDEVASPIAITGNEDKTTFNEKVCQIIRDYIGANPGSTKDRIYDEVVSRMVRSGQMEAHDFVELLRTVAEEVKTPVMKNLFEKKDPDLFGTHEIGRWYLKETELVIADAAENAREDAAAEKIGVFIKGLLKKNPEDEGVHYSDLFENYIYSVKDKPRRQLAEFLPDYFYKTEQGTWRLPISGEEEKAKREARVKGLGRRVKRYIAQLDQGAVIPDHERPSNATLAEWIRHCKRAGLYEQGKLLYEKGGLNLDSLPEESMVNVEEDYQVCARLLAREASEPKRHGRKKAGK